MTARQQLRRLSLAALFLLMFLAPFGTRYIWSYGLIDGQSVEWGSLSLFVTQLLAGLFVLLAVLASGWRRLFEAILRPASVVALVLTAAACLSAAFGAVPWERDTSFLSAAWIGLGALVLIAVTAVRPTSRFLYWPLFLASIIQSAFGLLQFAAQRTWDYKWLGLSGHSATDMGAFVVEAASGRWLRAYGAFGHPNLLGLFSVIGLFVAVGLLARKTKVRWLVWAGLPLLGAGLFVSLSKSAGLALIASLAVSITASLLMRQGGMAKLLVMLGLVAALGVAAIAVRYPSLVMARLGGEGRLEERSWNERIELTEDAFFLIGRHPWLGVGPGQMSGAVRRELADSRQPWDYQPVHNVPLLVVAETGAVGAVAWLAFALILLWSAVRAAHLPFRRTKTPAIADGRSGFCVDDYSQSRPLNLTVSFALMAAMATVGLFDHFLWSLWPGQLIFWLISAVIVTSVLEKNG